MDKLEVKGRRLNGLHRENAGCCRDIQLCLRRLILVLRCLTRIQLGQDEYAGVLAVHEPKCLIAIALLAHMSLGFGPLRRVSVWILGRCGRYVKLGLCPLLPEVASLVNDLLLQFWRRGLCQDIARHLGLGSGALATSHIVLTVAPVELLFFNLERLDVSLVALR